MDHSKAIDELKMEIHTSLNETCKSAEVVCDQIFQDACNRYKVYMDTSQYNLIVYDRKGVGLIDSDPFCLTMNNMFRFMRDTFGSVFIGKEYAPQPIKNHKLPDVVILTSQIGDWEAMYVHGKSILQGHKITRKEFSEVVMKYQLQTNQILEIESSDVDSEMVNGLGSFPDLLEDLLTDYNEDGTVGESDEPQRCKFDEAWRGKCGEPVVRLEDYCRNHINLKCSCGEQATHNCEHTMGPMICGRNLCDSCRCNH